MTARVPKLPPYTGEFYLGIDENGMGPRLGPLVVTSIIARARTGTDGAKIGTSKPRGALAKRIGDSKKLITSGETALGEAWARAIVQRRAERAAGVRGQEVPDAGLTTGALTPADLLSTISLDTDEALRSPCPSHHADLCWGSEGEGFAADDDEVARCLKDLSRLEERGLEILGVRLGVVCVRKLNDAVDGGLSRFDVDLHTMERLTLAAVADVGTDVYALCGKVGGFDFYADRFGPLGGRLHTVLCEGRARSEYLLPGVGRLAFLRDGDDSHLLIALASLIGKWARDLLMHRIVQWHRGHVPDVPEASGYHDPVSTQFIATTSLVRKTLRVDTHCFERTSLGRRGAEGLRG